MARTRAELVANLAAFRDIWADRRERHPDPGIRARAVGTAAMYAEAVGRAERGAPLEAVCGGLSGYARQLHGCEAAIAAERAGDVEPTDGGAER